MARQGRTRTLSPPEDIQARGQSGQRITGRLYGPAGAPLVVVLGGISASRFVAAGAGERQGWWPELVCQGGAIDLQRFRVLGMEHAPEDGAGAQAAVTTEDQASRLRILLDQLGVARAAAVIGSSYGGMVGLAFARLYPKRLERLCVISASHRPYPPGVAWRGIQRRIVRLGLASGQAEDGLRLARELAMTTYRTPQEFAARFSARQSGHAPLRFDVCDYLHHCGERFARTMTAARFLALSESIDRHRIEPEGIRTPALLIAVDSDQLAPPEEMQALQARLGGPALLRTISSPYGHDAFLKETQKLSPLLSRFCQEPCHVRQAC